MLRMKELMRVGPICPSPSRHLPCSHTSSHLLAAILCALFVSLLVQSMWTFVVLIECRHCIQIIVSFVVVELIHRRHWIQKRVAPSLVVEMIKRWHCIEVRVSPWPATQRRSYSLFLELWGLRTRFHWWSRFLFRILCVFLDFRFGFFLMM